MKTPADADNGNALAESGQLDLLVVGHSQTAPDHSGRDQADENTDAWWKACASAAIEELARSGREFTAWDLVQQCGLTEPDSSKRWGAAFGRAHKAGVIQLVRAEPSRRPSANGALCRVWRGRDAA